MGWRIEVKPFDLRLVVREELRDQELVTSGSTRVTYWEGAVRASGSFGETPVTGGGYVEMTGYDKRFGDRRSSHSSGRFGR
jgi:Predicted secreted hydrolase